MELLELALSMEYDLKDFYNKQAELNDGNSLCTIFKLLEKEEEKHAQILKSYNNLIELPLTDSTILSDVKSIFKETDNFKSEIKKLPNQLDVYRMALEKEEQSLKFYQDLFDKASDEKSKKVFGYLIDQEDKHCIIMEELVKLVTRPEEWVESAEFGRREDY
jgi:rubrerythrin